MHRIRDVAWRDERGLGTVFRFMDADTGNPVSVNFYISFRANGKEQLLSAKTTDLQDAKKELRNRLRNVSNAREGKEALITPRMERVTASDLLDSNLTRAEAKGLASLKVNLRYQTEILRKLLGHVKALEFRPEHVDDYISRRLRGEGSKHGKRVSLVAIKHELQVLQKAFNFAVARGVLRTAPYIEIPCVDNIRQKEVPLEEFPRILAAITDNDCRDVVEWILLTATRPKGIAALLWQWFDSKSWTLEVPAEKGGNTRRFSIEGSLREVFERRIARRRPGCPYIFHSKGQQLETRRVRRAFYAALEACELPTGREGLTVYDTKSTAVGVLLDAGLSDAEAMDFSGHRTASMLHRYAKKTAARHGASVRKRDEYLKHRLAEKAPTVAERVAVFPNVSATNPNFES